MGRTPPTASGPQNAPYTGRFPKQQAKRKAKPNLSPDMHEGKESVCAKVDHPPDVFMSRAGQAEHFVKDETTLAKFHIRARTIDLLGRQQVASISTAISELFKNAHDAYANTAEIDYFRDDGLFVLRDDGLGMTRSDFEQRWLTLGTDSKVGANQGLARPAVDNSKEIRPLLGEKGIGRLAIALIGRQVLVLTRARVANLPQDEITAAYLHWGMFELPGVDLDDISISLETFSSERLPNADEIDAMVSKAKASLVELGSRVDDKARQKILDEMQNFKVNPQEISTYLVSPSLHGDGTGTHFYILPADDILKDDIDDRDDESKATRFERNLIGFTNTMTPAFKAPKILTKFRDHLDEGEPIERVGERAFFSPEEFNQVDHHIQGRFDEFGQFHGKVGVYQTSPVDYVLNWNNSEGRPTLCGPFHFSVAVIQPTLRDSLVEPTAHALIRRKLERHGGIYIYKDGIRVQPYGGTENDFLDLERRRNQRAATYYYSFRNMMGAVELNSKDNASLVEKAGREGFRDDRAYRQFRSILINFFIQSAADFFVENGRYSEEWTDQRSELQRLDDVRKRREKQSGAKKEKFGEQLKSFFTSIDSGALIKSTQSIKEEFDRKLLAELSSSKPVQAKAQAVGRIEMEAKSELDTLRKSFAVSKPRGVGLNKELLNNWASYQVELRRVSEDVFVPLEQKIEAQITNIVNERKLNLLPSLRLNAVVRKHSENAVSTIRELRTQTEDTLTSLNRVVREVAKESFRNVSRVVDDVIADLEKAKADPQLAFDFSTVRASYERTVDSAFVRESERLRKVAAQLDAILTAAGSDGIDLVEVTEAFEEEVVALRDRQAIDFELSQIGMAINTINHEFGKTAAGLRDGFRRLKSWSNANPELSKLYEDMRASFDHLDAYLSLFNPLDRRLQQNAVDISGAEVFRFVSDLFDKRLKRHKISLVCDEAFKRFVYHGFQADLYPPFVNLVDNAIYWVTSKRLTDGTIELTGDGDDVCVRDNGPGVGRMDVKNIFEMNFSRKPGGRGMGLHISKQALARLGYRLTLDAPEAGGGACFRISKFSNPE